MLRPVHTTAFVLICVCALGGCERATASERPVPSAASAVSLSLPQAPPAAGLVAAVSAASLVATVPTSTRAADSTAAALNQKTGSSKPAASRLRGELLSRAQDVTATLKSAAGGWFFVDAPPDGLRELRAALHRHGVLGRPQSDPLVPVIDCDLDGRAEDRAACWIDALIWAESLIVDGAGLGARSQALPPHRKRLSRKERATKTAAALRRHTRAVALVAKALSAGTPVGEIIETWLKEVGPARWQVYRGLVKALKRYRDLAEQPIAALSPDAPIATKHAHRRRKERRQWFAAMTPERRLQLRARLCAEGYCAAAPALLNDKAPTLPLDKALWAQLAAWQGHRGLRPSGLVNKETAAELNVPMAARVQQIRLSLQRIRDTEVGASEDFLIANIPAFRLDIWRDRAHTTSHLTQVGKGIKRVRRKVRGRKRWLWVPGMRTPMISAKIKNLVLNPEWVVPSSIRREYRWKIRNDDNWLADNGFEMRPASNGGDYMVMKSGPTNLLGQVKFIFPNTHLVYLHDTPKQRGFKYPVRLRSHGCVRVERALELARTLLSADIGKKWTDKKWAKYLEKHQSKWRRLRKPLDLHIVYWTADVAGDGTPRFYRDFYKYDSADMRRVADVALANLPADLRAPATSIPAGPSRPQIPGKSSRSE
jgi:murein L,D-transpeptidase YcbB/YkuD